MNRRRPVPRAARRAVPRAAALVGLAVWASSVLCALGTVGAPVASAQDTTTPTTSTTSTTTPVPTVMETIPAPSTTAPTADVGVADDGFPVGVAVALGSAVAIVVGAAVVTRRREG